MSTLPTMTEAVDDAFTHTWDEIRKEAIDTILDANVVTALLKERGCFKTQVGGKIITRTVRYGKKTAVTFGKGDVLPEGEDDIETMAWWKWAYTASHVQRTLIDDQQNSGKSAIKNLVQTKIGAARDALSEELESQILAAVDTTVADLRATLDPYSLYNILPPIAYGESASYTYGNITFGNSWWRPKYKAATAVPEENLLADMRNHYNTVGDNIAPPNMLLTTQEIFELYEDFVMDKIQIVTDESTKLANLGFDVLRFKGKPIVWSKSVQANSMAFLNTNFIEVVHDPSLWFEMSEWRTPARQMERIAYIVSAMDIVCPQLRRQGLLYDITLA